MSLGLENRDLLVEHILSRAKHGLPSTVIGLPGLIKGGFSQLITESANNTDGMVSIALNIQAVPETNPYNIFYAIRQELLMMIPDGPPIDSYAFDDNFYKVIDDIHRLVKELGKHNDQLLITLFKMSEYKAPKDVWENIGALRNIAKNITVTFCFIDNPNLLRFKDGIASFGGLYDYIMNTILWLKLSSRAHFDREMEYWSDYYDYAFPVELQDFIWKQTGGHPSLMKYMINYFFENSSIKVDIAAISENYALNTKLEHLIFALDEAEKEVLYEIAHSGEYSRAKNSSLLSSLINYDLIESTDKGLKLKMGLLQDFLLKDDSINTTRIRDQIRLPNLVQEKTYDIRLNQGEVFIDGVKIDAEFSEREYHLLEYLISKRGKICTREDIADVIWKDSSTDKYSDWSLDQIVSRIRKKLKDNGYKPKYIKTLRGRGFKLEM